MILALRNRSPQTKTNSKITKIVILQKRKSEYYFSQGCIRCHWDRMLLFLIKKVIHFYPHNGNIR